nr:longitudinals lacking protein, isoforms J/P/Q/S/Z isoform X2 [Bactrocera oleae]XP_036233215.1 longitudinals lacking protein, isoforms J/P/Q/S/Z isoform X2 [Bactrocera oleae]XP_036233222.1 longitudinals lacking protein, isoforms J/P/Q/S/Z isoform X2 [Bactrocera oleae]XP_036233226.1 longitudinals lacking protein, isoforms J/P/Q/S/Z isoform X2 [Bactrocera oleae]XP_036233232.1 longitudinals lacking protein, isoforms J/P/Q/S/Z isoform X2 [Bactrocera oleae]XP_036233240.1 longitudinals lacking pro
MEDDQQFCLRWNNHQSTLISVFDTLLENQTLVDCTLAAEGKFLKAHKVVLSACSPFFATLLQQQYDKHPIFILKDVKYQELRAMMDYMYRGEVNISQDQLAALLKAAESLQIKGLSDNRSGSTPKTEQHRGLNVPGSGSNIGGGGKLSGYTLEQTQSKRPRVGPSPMETADISGSREGSSSPSRRRRKVRRRSVENAMSDVHDNSNSSQINQSSLQPQQQPQTNASLTGVGALAAATSSLPVSASALSTGSSGVLAATGSIVSTQGTTQQMTTNITKKTESVKGASDAMNSDNIPTVGVVGTGDEQNVEHLKGEKSNHKQKSSAAGVAGKETAEMVIEPKSEYEEEGNEETVEDLTLDDEEMGMDDLDQNAGTSQAGEGSSQGYAPWQHDRSQDELLLAPQEAQQRDPQDGLLQQGFQSAPISTCSTGAAITSAAGNNVYSAEAQTQSQSESRIRVRDWLMLADQSILQKTIEQQPDQSLTTTTNAATNTITAATALSNVDMNAHNLAIPTPAIVSSSMATTTVTSVNATPNKQPTLMRIGSIGRTTITCVAPAGTGDDGVMNLLNNGNMGVISAAALAASGVELESVDESMTEVLVKIENSSSSTQEEDEEMEAEAEAEGEDEGEVEGEGELAEDDDEQQAGDNGKESDFNYELKLSSPMSWAFDTVKIENEEEFEDILSGEQDTTNTEDEDDLLTTAAATTKQAAAGSSEHNTHVNTNVATHTECAELPARTHEAATNRAESVSHKGGQQRGAGKRHTMLERKETTTLLSKQQQQLLLEQQQHLQHLQLRPTQQMLQFKLASIPATITSITTTTTTAATANKHNSNGVKDTASTGVGGGVAGDGVGGIIVGTPTAANSEPHPKLLTSTGNSGKSSANAGDFKSSVSDDKRYRILVQNQRMRKESLEHSEDMIYNADIEKPWVCRNCNRNYKWKNSLKCHLKNECGQPPRYFCSKLCGYATNVHSNLKRHLNTKCRDRMEEDQKNNTSTYTLVFQQNE